MAQGHPALLGHVVGRLGTTANEGFLGPDVFCFFELLELQRQAAVRYFQPLFQGREVVRPVKLESGQHA